MYTIYMRYYVIQTYCIYRKILLALKIVAIMISVIQSGRISFSSAFVSKLAKDTKISEASLDCQKRTSIIINKSKDIGALKCKFPPFYGIMTVRRTCGFIGKLHFNKDKF